MVRWIVNELSLEGQFSTASAFLAVIEPLARLQAQSAAIRESLYCTRNLSQRPVCGGDSLASVVGSSTTREKKQLILSWVTRSALFVEEDRQSERDDLFYFANTDITESGLGEAARRVKDGQSAGVFSFLGGSSLDFSPDPLVVTHGLLEEPLGQLGVPNETEVSLIELRSLSAMPTPRTWRDLLSDCQLRFPKLIIPDTILYKLEHEAFQPNVCKRVIELLKVLNEYISERLPTGEESERAKEIRAQHFIGEKALFTDESDRNKSDFRIDMTFADPDNRDKRIFCPWHGKIKTPQYRIHFEWPVPSGQKKLKVLYIGPKITKR
jgi:hypothetical protein